MLHDRALIFKSWEAINSFFTDKASTIRNKGCCLKAWFKVAFEDCFLYSGRYDILEPSREEANLKKHIRDFCSFSSGRKRNPGLTERGYENIVNNFPAQKMACGLLEELDDFKDFIGDLHFSDHDLENDTLACRNAVPGLDIRVFKPTFRTFLIDFPIF